tara:strand:+ start:268 stop:1053 length:786 start_codon:yes stop_codon:yes gene_type:complete
MHFGQLAAVVGLLGLAPLGSSMNADAAPAKARAAGCTAAFKPADGEPLSFRRRGSRCEGLYAKLVGVPSTLRIIGFHVGRLADTKFGVLVPKVAVRILAPPQIIGVGVLRLRALATDPTVFYAMDTSEIPNSGTYEWSSEVLSAKRVDLAANQLALVACTTDCDGRTSTFYPVTMTQPGGRSGPATIIIASAKRILRLDWKLRDEKGRILASGSLRGPFSPGIPIPLTVDGKGFGNARLELVGTAPDGSPSFLLARLMWPS